MLRTAILDDRQIDRWTKSGRTAVLVGFAVVTALTTLGAGADILVMQDGSQVETDGAWQVEGRQVQFTATNGILSAVRLSEVDLEASEQATMDAMKMAVADSEMETAREPLPEPVWVLTDEDIPDASDDEFESAAQVAAAGQVQVADSSYESTNDNQFTISGTVINTSAVAVEGLSVGVTASVIDDSGRSHELKRDAVVEDTELEAGGSTTFRYVLGETDINTAGGDAELWANAVIDFAVDFAAEEPPAADADSDFEVGDEIEFVDEDAEFPEEP